jgi:signal transduction histidine kinase
METKREKMDLHDPLREAIPLIEHELKKASIQLVEQLDTSLPPILGSRVEIGQVFLNLIINATHAMEGKGGTLTVKSYAADGGLAIEFSDTGCGISAENRARIFEPLFTTKGTKGTGIGLSVSQKIVTNHNGKISVTSEVGKGTTFRIWMPKAT